jgi:16S rRNA pseudouridine516 synthase
VIKLTRHLTRLGYGSRREVERLIIDGRVTDAQGVPVGTDGGFAHDTLRVDGQPLDPPPASVVLLHKPLGHVCSTRDSGPLIYDLLPSRFRARRPLMSPVGRLDRDTSGLLLLTDDGALLHRIIAPRSAVRKRYEVTLARDLHGEEAAVFASGQLLLRSETSPLAPAELLVHGRRSASVILREGRYHQVRRMFAAVGNHVEALHRSAVGALTLGDLAPGRWRLLAPAEVEAIFRN